MGTRLGHLTVERDTLARERDVFVKDLEVRPEVLAHERYEKEVNTYNDVATKLYKFSER